MADGGQCTPFYWGGGGGTQYTVAIATNHREKMVMASLYHIYNEDTSKACNVTPSRDGWKSPARLPNQFRGGKCQTRPLVDGIVEVAGPVLVAYAVQ